MLRKIAGLHEDMYLYCGTYMLILHPYDSSVHSTGHEATSVSHPLSTGW